MRQAEALALHPFVWLLTRTVRLRRAPSRHCCRCVCLLSVAAVWARCVWAVLCAAACRREDGARSLRQTTHTSPRCRRSLASPRLSLSRPATPDAPQRNHCIDTDTAPPYAPSRVASYTRHSAAAVAMQSLRRSLLTAGSRLPSATAAVQSQPSARCIASSARASAPAAATPSAAADSSAAKAEAAQFVHTGALDESATQSYRRPRLPMPEVAHADLHGSVHRVAKVRAVVPAQLTPEEQGTGANFIPTLLRPAEWIKVRRTNGAGGCAHGAAFDLCALAWHSIRLLPLPAAAWMRQ